MFEKLFEPLKIRGMEVKNRIVLPAMGTKMAAEDGAVTQQIIDYQVARVKGGCGLNLSEVCAVHAPSAPENFWPCITTPISLRTEHFVMLFMRQGENAAYSCGREVWQPAWIQRQGYWLPVI